MGLLIELCLGSAFQLKICSLTIIVVGRDWPDLNRRPSASDWCEFPHSLDYSFTLGKLPLGGGRYVVGGYKYNIPLTLYNQSLHLLYQGSRAWLKITLSVPRLRLP